jgi:hypothetical protein
MRIDPRTGEVDCFQLDLPWIVNNGSDDMNLTGAEALIRSLVLESVRVVVRLMHACA